MQKKGILIVILILSALFVFLIFPIIANFNPLYGDPTLEFPVQNPNNVTKLSGYNHPDWGEPGKLHNGIDLVCRNYTALVAPISGLVIRITENKNPYKDFIMFHVTIMANYFWNVELTFEPNLNTSEGNDLQRSLIFVHLFQIVKTGDVLGILLNGSSDYPHLHIMLSNTFFGTFCPYALSSAAAKLTYDAIANRTGETICYSGTNPENFTVMFASFGSLTAIICAIVIVVYLVRRRRSKKNKAYGIKYLISV